jgi:hypothetical protein
MAEREHAKQIKKEEARLRRNAKARDKRAATKAERQRLEQLENPMREGGSVGGGFGGTIEPTAGFPGERPGVWRIFDTSYPLGDSTDDDENAFRTGFVDRDVDPVSRQAARMEYFELSGLTEATFDWSGWREEMGYE